MSDIVTTLRTFIRPPGEWARDKVKCRGVMNDAADEIERLRAEIKQYEEVIIPSWKREEEMWRKDEKDAVEFRRVLAEEIDRLESDAAGQRYELYEFAGWLAENGEDLFEMPNAALVALVDRFKAQRGKRVGGSVLPPGLCGQAPDVLDQEFPGVDEFCLINLRATIGSASCPSDKAWQDAQRDRRWLLNDRKRLVDFTWEQLGEIDALRNQRDRAIGHLRDVLAADDGQAWKEAQRFLDGLNDNH